MRVHVPPRALLTEASCSLAMPIGGGQDILARMKDYITQPNRIINVKGALDTTVTPVAGGLRIGAAVKIADLAENAQVNRLYPNVTSAALLIGTPQIARATADGGPAVLVTTPWRIDGKTYNAVLLADEIGRAHV